MPVAALALLLGARRALLNQASLLERALGLRIGGDPAVLLPIVPALIAAAIRPDPQSARSTVSVVQAAAMLRASVAWTYTSASLYQNQRMNRGPPERCWSGW